jgi:hypothetical protein
MRKLVVSLLVAFVIAACAPSIRYTLSELEGLSPQMQERIKRGEVAKGMTFQEVRYAWGAPNRVIVKGADAQGRFIEVWIFAPARVFGKKVVFADGKVIEAYTRVTRSDVREDIGKKPASREETMPETSGGEQNPEGEEILE